ncbi:MAG: trigger factor [Candidatus Cloacimonetes bacterium]|nr:trigger factor [Candidatus Cloacimonadota bacterium]
MKKKKKKGVSTLVKPEEVPVNLQVETTEKSQCLHELTITINAEDAKREYGNMLINMRQHVNIPGFRKGKAPLNMVETMYGDYARMEFIKEKMQDYYTKAVEDNNLEPLFPGEPLDICEEWKPGEELIFRYQFEVKPNVEIKQYKNLKIGFEPRILTDEIVDIEIENMREKMSALVEVDKPAENGLYAHIQLTIPKEDDGWHAPTERDIEIGENHFSSAINEKLRGAMPVLEFEAILFDVEDDADKKNQTGPFYTKPSRIKLLSVKELVLPVLDDAFAKDADYENLAEMKSKIREELEQEYRQENNKNKIAAISEALVKANDLEIPPSLVRQYTSELVKPMAEQYNMPREELFKAYESIAATEIKKMYLIDELKQIENIDVTDEDKEMLIAEVAENVNLSISEYKDRYAKVIDSEGFKGRIIERKIYSLIEASSEFVPPETLKEDKEVKESSEEVSEIETSDEVQSETVENEETAPAEEK